MCLFVLCIKICSIQIFYKYTLNNLELDRIEFHLHNAISTIFSVYYNLIPSISIVYVSVCLIWPMNFLLLSMQEHNQSTASNTQKINVVSPWCQWETVRFQKKWKLSVKLWLSTWIYAFIVAQWRDRFHAGIKVIISHERCIWNICMSFVKLHINITGLQ